MVPFHQRTALSPQLFCKIKPHVRCGALICAVPCLFITESLKGYGWKRSYRLPLSTHPALGRDPFHQPRVLRAPSNLALNTAREGAATASLGNLCQGLTTLRVKDFFLLSNLNLPSFSLKPLPLVLPLNALVKSPSPAFLQAPSWQEKSYLY